jgi:hypothetical protein
VLETWLQPLAGRLACGLRAEVPLANPDWAGEGAWRMKLAYQGETGAGGGRSNGRCGPKNANLQLALETLFLDLPGFPQPSFERGAGAISGDAARPRNAYLCLVLTRSLAERCDGAQGALGTDPTRLQVRLKAQRGRSAPIKRSTAGALARQGISEAR